MNVEFDARIVLKIQWACNTQMDLMLRYESTYGYSSRHEIWAEFKQQLKVYLSDEVMLGMDTHLANNLYQFLVQCPSAYHLEMSSDEMIGAFLGFLKNN